MKDRISGGQIESLLSVSKGNSRTELPRFRFAVSFHQHAEGSITFVLLTASPPS